MIKIIRRNKYSLELYFDLTGAEEFIDALEKALLSEESLLDLESESRFNENKKINQLRIICNETEDKISYQSGILTLELDNDGLELGLQKFQACVLGQDFYPAEFCDVMSETSRQEMTLYGFFEKKDNQ